MRRSIIVAVRNRFRQAVSCGVLASFVVAILDILPQYFRAEVNYSRIGVMFHPVRAKSAWIRLWHSSRVSALRDHRNRKDCSMANSTTTSHISFVGTVFVTVTD